MKNVILLALGLACLSAGAQVSIGTEGFSVQNGTTFSADGFVLIPSAPATITNNLLQKSTTPVTIRDHVSSIAILSTFSNPITVSGTIRFYYQNANLNGNPETGLTLAYFDGAVWRNTSGAVVNTVEKYIEETVTNKTFTGISGSTYITPLPVSLLSFTARLSVTNTVQVQWQTASEAANRYFTIERSGDGRRFEAIGTVQAARTTGGNSYQFTDAHPASINYYRLRQHDNDGKEHLYGVRLVKMNEKSATILLQPNPATHGFTFDIGRAVTKPVPYSVINAAGQIVQSGTLTNQRQWVATQHLTAGSYLLHLATGRSIHFQKQ